MPTWPYSTRSVRTSVVPSRRRYRLEVGIRYAPEDTDFTVSALGTCSSVVYFIHVSVPKR